MADFLETHNTECDNSAYNSLETNFWLALLADYLYRPIPTFKFVPPPLFAFTILTAYSQFGQLILKKIIKNVVTRCYILMVKCTKFDFGWGSVPQKRNDIIVIVV